MAPRRRQAAEEEQDEGGDVEGLQFNETLSWRAGKPIPTGELVKRLDTLSIELAELDQEWEHKDSLTKIAKELSSHQILAHKDKGVRAFAACCLVDILKICAPNAPFSPAQLKEIFNLIITSILPALQDPSHTYNNQHKYVLASLTDVKSILLLEELPNNDALFAHLFTSFFDSVSGSKAASGEQISRDVIQYMTDMLAVIIDETAALPAKVIDIIMAQFLRAAAPGAGRDKTEQGAIDENQSTLLIKEEPEAYQMARSVCNMHPDKMARYIGQYFSDVIMEASGIARSNGNRADEDSDEEEGVAGPSEADLKELRKAHLLIRELWKAAPMVLQNVIPQVDAELSADNVHLRQLATETLGDMISGIGAAGPPSPPVLDPAVYPPLKISDEAPDSRSSNPLKTPLSPHSFAQGHPAAYQNFVGRRNDKSPLIRAAWTIAAGYILSTDAGGIGLSRDDETTLVRGLGEKLNDSDEKVRLAGIKAVESFSFRDVILKLAPHGGVSKENSVLGNLADRCRDRKPNVRVDAMTLLGRLWAAATGELALGNDVVATALSGVPSRVCNAFYANDLELNVLLDTVIFECLVPLAFPPPPKKGTKGTNGSSQTQSQSGPAAYDPDAIRAERILLLVQSLDTTAKKAFFAMQARQPQFAKILATFVKQCEEFNGGVMDEEATQKTANLNRTVKYMAQFLPDGVKASQELHKFAKANDRRNYQLIKFIVSQESDFKTVHRALKELAKRIQGSQHSNVLETLLPLLYRSGYLIFNRSHLSTILEYSKSDRDGMGATALEVLNEISQRSPDLFKTHIGELCKDLVEQAPSATKENEPAAVESLKACSSYARKYPEEIPTDRSFNQTLVNYALYGQPWKAAKYAVNILLAKKDEKSLVNATDVIQKVMKDWKYDSPHFLNKLAVVSQLEVLAPKVTDTYDETILDMTVQKILKQVRSDASAKDPDWAEDSEIDEECQAKCLALKILVNRVRSVEGTARGDSVKDLQDRAKPVFKLLKTIIKNEGEFCKTKDTPKHHKSRLRLVAAQLVLKLCTERHFDDMLPPDDFNALATVTQDSHPQVRRAFIEKLQKYLVQAKLRPKFYTIIFLAAFEPAQDFKQRIETWIRSRVHHYQVSGQPVMEAIMARLLSLLAHHPDFSTDSDDLVDHARYILFYVSNVATESNLGLIFRYAERVKQTRDAINPDMSENLYVVSDLAQAVVRKWQEKKGWAFEAYGQKIGLPTGLYLALPSHEAAQEIAEKQYIPDGIDDKLDDLLRTVDRKKKRKSVDDRAEVHPPAKKAKPTVKVAKTAAQPKVAKVPAKKAAPKAKTPAKPKKAKAFSSSPVADSERRRSGRSRHAQTYIERDSSEDDEEMLDGVAEWDYEEGKDSDQEDNGPEAADDEEKEIEEVEPEAEEQLPESEEEDEPTPPPATNGRKGRNASASRAKPKPTPKPVAKAKPASKAAASGTASTTGKGRGKKAKDIYEMDID
ncbi:hypothetical protein UCRPA7_88 [Phaeoacremonium minimum UCRPA7]|uniref:Uncharacterized protein n=1 Tax=Phaeoacremonium minimum (strain UCR-PA7) TaxID=1286976 RepID=R8BYQ8_PHAM7|nr:hypothetical protein UCRPA7_88 [Phaeoacremonium minimum UCRPA7]EOO04414.1 hypothetical protein UCRPA7_88 [Phaeoacremonium minimum UCRPA7]